MFKQRITITISLALALAAAAAPAAWGDPPPLAQAESAIAQVSAQSPATTAPCGDVCSGHGYGAVSATSQTPVTTASCGDVCSGHGYGSVSVPASIVRVVAPGGGFDWRDAGIGAVSMLALTVIGLGGVLAANRRSRRASQQQVSASS